MDEVEREVAAWSAGPAIGIVEVDDSLRTRAATCATWPGATHQVRVASTDRDALELAAGRPLALLWVCEHEVVATAGVVAEGAFVAYNGAILLGRPAPLVPGSPRATAHAPGIAPPGRAGQPEVVDTAPAPRIASIDPWWSASGLRALARKVTNSQTADR